MKYDVVSLFSGAGGLDIGLENAGFNTVFAGDVQEYCCKTLEMNRKICTAEQERFEKYISKILDQRCYSRVSSVEKNALVSRLKSRRNVNHLKSANIVCSDIRDLECDSILDAVGGSPFLVAGGPPCQPFSKAGKRKAVDCAKNGDLFYEFVRVVDGVRPKWFLFENVKGITFTKTDLVYGVCDKCGHKDLVPFPIRQDWISNSEYIGTCEKCSGDVSSFFVENKPGGSLEMVLREFERIGYKCYPKVLNAVGFGAPQIRERLFIVGSLDGVDFDWPEETHVYRNGDQSKLVDLMLNRSKAVSMFDALWKNGHWFYGRVNRGSACLWVKNVVRPHDEPVTWSLDRPSPTIGAHQAAKLAFAPLGVPDKQIFRQQWHTAGRRQGDTPPVDVEHKYLSDEELLTLQTFPSWWYLHGTRMERAFQIGNAVPPILAEVVGRAILNAERRAK